MKKHETLCVLPWTHLVNSFGELKPCCHILPSFGKVTASNDLSKDLNGREMLELREQMLAGKKPASCEKCFKLEESGFYSERNRYNEDNPQELEKIIGRNSAMTSLDQILSVDIRLSNECNLACRTCTAESSTSWNNESVALKRIDNPINLRTEINSIPDFPNCRSYYFAGGEPLLEKQHKQYLESISSPEKKILKYNTNLSYSLKHLKSFSEIWNRFKKVEIYASIDHIDKSAFEFIRHRSSWRDVSKNLNYLMESPYELNIQLTLSILNIFDLDRIIDTFISKYHLTESRIIILPVLDPVCFSISTLPKDKKEAVTRKLNKHFKNKISNENFSEDAIKLYSRIKSMLDYMNQHDTSEHYAVFLELNKTLDRWRNQIYKRALPSNPSLD